MAYSHDISKISVNDNMPRNSTGYSKEIRRRYQEDSKDFLKP